MAAQDPEVMASGNKYMSTNRIHVAANFRPSDALIAPTFIHSADTRFASILGAVSYACLDTPADQMFRGLSVCINCYNTCKDGRSAARSCFMDSRWCRIDDPDTTLCSCKHVQYFCNKNGT